MAWTNPKTWTHGELVTKAMMDEQIRDNMLYLYNALKIAGGIDLSISRAIPPLSTITPAAIEQIESSGASKPNNIQARFDASADEGLMWQFTLPATYSGTMTIKVLYYMASATAGNVCFAAQVSAKGDGDSGMTARVFDTANTETQAVPGTAGTLKVLEIELTNDDSMAAGDSVILLLYRDVDPNDTAAGDCVVVDVIAS